MLDANVIVRARAGDAAAIDDLARHVLAIALRVAASITGSRDTADDIAQTTTMLALGALGKLRDETKLDAWVARTATRESLRHLASPQRVRESLEADVEPRATSLPADLAFERLAGDPDVRAALARLSPQQRAALSLRYVLDLDDRSIARALGCRVGTVHALLSRGRARLRADTSLSPFHPQRIPAERASTHPHHPRR